MDPPPAGFNGRRTARRRGGPCYAPAMTRGAERGPGGRASRAMTPAERERFDTFLKIAAESPFPGERANALDAARRLAGRCAMSLDQARRGQARPAAPVPPPRPAPRSAAGLAEARLRAERERHERALREAVARGLDRETRGRGGAARPRPAFNARRRDSQSFARVLLEETGLPLTEIVSLTGLDIYKVVGLKLKMRPFA